MKLILKFTVFLFVLFLAIGCTPECAHKEHLVNDSRPENAITYKEMAGMFHQYDVGQKKVLDKYRKEFTRNKQDTIESISHFYEIAQLKQYIAYLERLSKEKDIELTGVRIFSAAYPRDHSTIAKRGRQTLIFMPTAKIGNKNSVAFEPLYSEKGTPIKFTEFLNKFSSNATKRIQRASFLPFQILDGEDLESSGTNRLEHTPPY
ncbi:hypothetical protein [uncultured Polaribacter sp.]|uniref:hypothetical protein n=1 Tax=uncultured Polaribacter sp. TaxID=174711 RepID=UPI002610DFAF|nr:hypothetical protein [uncultured Polaribacter sp.]